MTGSIPARLFTALNPPEELPINQDVLPHPPPVPTTAIYSKGDGIVNWQTTLQVDGHPRTQSRQSLRHDPESCNLVPGGGEVVPGGGGVAPLRTQQLAAPALPRLRPLIS
jgi:hypothetical protein